MITDKKKILFTSYDGFPSLNVGGPNKIIHLLLNDVRTKEFDKIYLSSDYFKLYNNKDLPIKPDYKSLKRKITDFLYWKSKSYRSFFSGDKYLELYFKKKDLVFGRGIKNLRYDILHAHDTQSAYYFIDQKKPMLITIHSKGSFNRDQNFHESASNFIRSNLSNFTKREISAFNASNLIVFPSNSAKEYFLEDYAELKLFTSKIKVIYNGIDLDYIDSIAEDNNTSSILNIPNDVEIKILNVAEHVKQKNIIYILEIVHSLKYDFKKKVFCLNIGKGPESKNIQKVVNELNISSEFKFIDTMSNFRLISLMKSFDFYLSTSYRVIFDMVILEALSCGLTVYALNDGGNKEIISNGINGYIIENNKPKEIAEMITNNSKINKNIIRESILKFKVDEFYNSYKKIYNSIL